MAPFRQNAMAMLITTVFAQASAQTVAPAQLPTGGKVVAGQAAIQQSGSALNINQATQRSAIDWNTFNVGKDAQVNFNQPSASSVTLNRVLDTNASQIMGRINATGQVFLVNPNGVLFGPNSQVDVGGLVATTQNISNADFMAGKSTFEGDGRSGVSVVNQGQLNAALGGYIALLAPAVRNEGVVVAREGSVALAAGDKSVIEFSGTRMTSVLIDRAVMDALVDNRQVVRADGGWVLLSARSANAILSSVITNSGTVQANTVVNKNGRIVLEGGDQGVVSVSGNLQAAGVDAGTQGGSVVVTGDKVQIASGAQLDASGKAGGGSVLVGGGWQGQDPSIRQANAVVVESGARLDASATDQGNGGTVVVWSNTQNPDSVTRVAGELLARGGANGGDGGKIETSGHWLSTEGVKGDASAPKGKGGEWLFDPYDVTISATGSNSVGSTGTWTAPSSASTVSNASINSLLAAGTNVTISTGGVGSTGSDAGNITVDTTGGIAGTSTAPTKLTLTANHNITVNGAISVAGSGSKVELNAGNSLTSGNNAGGSVSLGAAVNVDTLSINVAGAGTVTQTAAVTTNNLKLSGSGASVTLDQATNHVGTIAADVNSLTLVNNTGIDRGSPYGTGLWVDQVDGLSGINAIGRVSITMNSGNIFLNKKIATAATDSLLSAPALMLNAGADISPNSAGAFVAGSGVNPYGPNIVRLSTDATLSVGTNGRGILYTGSVDGGSTALASYIGASSGRFRYNNDESTLSTALSPAGGLTPLLSGMNLIYRQQPLLSVSSSATQVYGDSLTPTITPTFSGYLNGDTLASSVSNPTALTIAIDGPTTQSKSTAGYYTAGSHPLTVSGAKSNLGYGFNYVPSNLTVNKKGLTVTVSALDKVYDSFTAASASILPPTAVVSGDVVGITSASAVFSDKNVGVGKTVTVSGLALTSGADAGNYLILNPGSTATATATITPRPITGNYTVQDKVYDGTTTATVTANSAGILSGDNVTFGNATANFVSKDVTPANSRSAVNLTAITLGGTDGTNYSIADNLSTLGLTGLITPKHITASFTGIGKIYDGTASATVTGSTTSFVGGDAPVYVFSQTGGANFVDINGNPDKSAGTGKTILVTGFSLMNPTTNPNAGAGNYIIDNATALTTAEIAKKPATLNFAGVTASNKIYDGTTTATLNAGASSGTFAGLVSGDNVVQNVVGNFSDKNAGLAKTVTMTATYSGTDAGNYTFTTLSPTTTANITPRSLAVTAVGVDKIYDATNTATYSLVSNQVVGDALTLKATSGLFDTKDVSRDSNNQVLNKTVTIGGISVSGVDALNYVLQNTSTTTSAKINPKGLTAMVSAGDKVYDGNSTAVATVSNLRGFVGQETVSIATDTQNRQLVTANYVDANAVPTANVADAKTVLVTGIQLNSGNNGGVATNYTIATGQSVAAQITPKALSVTLVGASSNNPIQKTYDGNTTATLASTNYNLTGFVTGESATVGKLVGAYNSRNVADATSISTTLSASDFSAGTGTTLSNYSLPTSASGAGRIVARVLSVNYTGVDKVYDGSTAATVTTTDDRVSGDTFIIGRSAYFANKDVAYLNGNQVTTQTVSITGVGLTGGDALNYTVNPTATASAKITPRSLSAALVGTIRKIYDGTTDASLMPSDYRVTGFVSGEGASVTQAAGTYNSRNVRDANTVSTSLTSGSFTFDEVVTKSGNYSLPTSASGAGLIAARTLNVSYTGVNKVYDGSAAATVTTADDRVNGDALIIQRTANFTDKNVAYDNTHQVANKTVSVTDVSLSGGDASNYSVSSTGTASAQIAPKSLTASISGVSKNYDGTADAAVVATPNGLSRGDAVQVTYQNAAFADSAPGMGKAITVSGISLSGTDAGNYSLSGPSSSTVYGSITLPTGCTGNCSQPVSVAPMASRMLASASASGLVSGVNAGAIQRTTDTSFQVPASAKPVAPAAVVPATPLDSVSANLSASNPSQVRSLSADQVSALPPAKLAELMPVLTPKQLMAVTPDQMAGLDATQLNQLVNLMDSALSKMKR